MYPGIELRLYRYVSVLAEELNYTQAASRLHVSQPTLSTQIRDLERELDVRLFERTKGGQQVVLTSSGEAFAAQARLALVHADRAIQEARAAHGQRSATLSLGYSPLIDFRVVSKVRRFLSDAHPAADVRFVSGHTAEHVDGLIRGRIDAGLVMLPVIENRVTFKVLHRERLLLALPNQHSLTKKKHIEVTDLHQLPLGEIRGGEAFDLLQLLNTGHSGTLSTVHANSAAQGLSRFTTCVLQSGIEIPYRAIKTNIADSLNIIVQIERRPGMRFVSQVLEINSYDPNADHYDFKVLYEREEGSCSQTKTAA